VNRSTYYKHFSGKLAPRTVENQKLRKIILEIYTTAKKRVGPAKIQRMILRDYGISISIGRIYRLMRTMNLPKMSTVKPVFKPTKNQVSLKHPNHLKQAFNPPAPNQVQHSVLPNLPLFESFTFVDILLRYTHTYIPTYVMRMCVCRCAYADELPVTCGRL